MITDLDKNKNNSIDFEEFRRLFGDTILQSSDDGFHKSNADRQGRVSAQRRALQRAKQQQQAIRGRVTVTQAETQLVAKLYDKFPSVRKAFRYARGG